MTDKFLGLFRVEIEDGDFFQILFVRIPGITSLRPFIVYRVANFRQLLFVFNFK